MGEVGIEPTTHRTQLTFPDGSTTLTYAYDAAHRLTQITQGTLNWTLSYDPAGNRTAIAQPNGTRTDYAYLTNNWLQSINHKRPDGATFQSFTYGYDANGNRASQADGTGTTTFTYDVLNRLTAAAYPGTYGSWSWIYDAVGNRTSQTAPNGTTPYSYDANSRLTTAGAVNYSYDANGNLTSTTAGQSFSWDAFNRLTQASGSGGSVSYTYNGDGLKLRRTGPDGATVYYYDGIRPIWEADGAGALKVQLDRDIFGNILSRREVSGIRRYFGHDGLGGLTAATDEAGTHLASLFYDAWGNLRASGGTWTDGNYRFTGAELDPATGLYHMGARFYDATLGRWLSEDPVQNEAFNPLSLNVYAYAWNSPTGLVDPSGLWPLEAIFGIFIHRRVEEYFRGRVAPFYGGTDVQTEYKVATGRLDMMMTIGGAREVYELKPVSHLFDPIKLEAASKQVNRYAGSVGGKPGTTWQPGGVTVPFNWLFDIRLTSLGTKGSEGVIGYELVSKHNASETLAKRYGWDPDFALAVLALLIVAWSNPNLIRSPVSP